MEVKMQEQYDNFRRDAAETGLITEHGQFDKENRFFLDLNQGGICVQGDAISLLTMVKLARKHARYEDHGEHQAILSLVAHRSRVTEKHVMWNRAHHVEGSRNNPEWISVKDWLEEQGHPYVPNATAT